MTDNVKGFTKEHRARVSGIVYDRETQQKLETGGKAGYGHKGIQEGTVPLISWDYETVKCKNETDAGSPTLQLTFFPTGDEKAAKTGDIEILFTNPPIGLPYVTAFGRDQQLDVGQKVEIPFQREGDAQYKVIVLRVADTSYKEWVVQIQQLLPLD